jgi:phenylalanyl-tRNA synthetase alpha chain
MLSLSVHEKKVLNYLLKSKADVVKLAKETGLKEDGVRKACELLVTKKLASVKEKKSRSFELTDEGKEYRQKGLPERRVLNYIEKDRAAIGDLNKKFGKELVKIATVWLRKDNLAVIEAGILKPTDHAEKHIKEKLPQEKALDYIGGEKDMPPAIKKSLAGLQKRNVIKIIESVEKTYEITAEGRKTVGRGLEITEEITNLTQELIVTKDWKRKKFKEYDVKYPVPVSYPGKKHFVTQSIEYVKKIWLEMGFKEMDGPYIDTSFWNFDALFVPQNHSAREMQDTLFIEGKGNLPDSSLVREVRKAHEEGVAGSTGWGGKWDEDIAKELLLRTHTTILSAKTLSELRKVDWPAKYFSVGKVFRNEALDWKHLFEFTQVDGIVVDENANFRHLIGYLKQFFGKLGFEKARFRPSYFPYTEPSLEIDIFHPVHKKWMELGGAGIFRPEVTEPLLGEPVPVLAWGPGYERMIMDYYKIMDIRELYKNDVQRLRDMKAWLM